MVKMQWLGLKANILHEMRLATQAASQFLKRNGQIK
jgi:hypothetical protein